MVGPGTVPRSSLNRRCGTLPGQTHRHHSPAGARAKAAEREFLRTLARAEPDWSLLDIPHLEKLPAVRWKLHNLQQLAISNRKRFD